MRRRSALGLLAGMTAAGVAGCTVTTNGMDTGSAARASSPVNRDDPAADSLAAVTPEFVAAAVADLPDSVALAMEQVGTPGVAVAVIHEGKTVYAKGFGVRSVDTKAPIDEHTVFQLASVSKCVGATVVARVIDQGTVSWTTPVVQHLPGFTLSDPWVGSHATIADMYAHRSGLYEHAGDELEEIGYDRAEVIRRLSLIPLAPFRSTYAYANFDITTAAESVAQAAGVDWADLSEQELYGPLGMADTSSRYADLEARDNRALGHVEVDGVWVVTPDQRQPDAQSPAGGVSSSITDLATWMTMLLADGQVDGGEFIAAETLRAAMSPKIVSGQNAATGDRVGTYGYGFNVTTSAGGYVDVNHSGAFALGAGTIIKMLPQAGLGIIVLTNGAPTGVAEGIAGRFMDLAQFGEKRQDWLTFFRAVFASQSLPFGTLVGATAPASPTPAQPLTAYAGAYANDYFGPATIVQDGDGLTLTLGPTGRWPLTHWDGDTFTFTPSGENAEPGSISQAIFGAGRLVLEYFDQEQLGTFTRAPG